MTFGERLYELRKNKNISQEELQKQRVNPRTTDESVNGI